MTTIQKTFLTMAATFLAGICPGRSEEAKLALDCRELWGNVFGGKETVFHISVAAPATVQATVSWQFTCEGRTIARGEQAVDVTPARPAVAEVKLIVPPVNEGVVMPASLVVTAGRASTELVKPLWIYPENPFAGRVEWLKKLDIRLFDPAGKTAAMLESAKVPFDLVKNLDALAEAQKCILVVGEGVSLREYRALPEVIVKAASRGVPVLCLALADGEFPFPGTQGNDFPFPSAVILKQNDIIRELDKKLDSVAWPPDGKIVASRLQLQGDRAGVTAAVVKEDTGWPWVELRFGKSALVICGFPIIEKWESGPTPRFLLERILEYASENK